VETNLRARSRAGSFDLQVEEPRGIRPGKTNREMYGSKFPANQTGGQAVSTPGQKNPGEMPAATLIRIEESSREVSPHLVGGVLWLSKV
jgi:hypothetical protein